MKRKIALCAGMLAFILGGPGPGLAQPVPPAYPDTAYPAYDVGLPPHEIVAIVRSTGLRPLSPPLRQGPAYVLRAVDPAGEEVRVIVNARMGRIVKVIPLAGPRYAMPLMRPPYGRPPRPIAMVPEGPGIDDPPPLNGSGGGSPSGPGHAPAASAPRDAVQAGPAPLPRPRPKLALSDSAAPKPVVPSATPPSQNAAKPGKDNDTTNAIGTPAAPAAAAAAAEQLE